MKNRWNAFLNKIFKSSIELELTGILNIALLKIFAAITGIAELEICRQLLEYLFVKDSTQLFIRCGIFLCLQIVRSIVERMVERYTETVRGNILLSMLSWIMNKNAKVLSVLDGEISINDTISIADGDCEKYVDGIVEKSTLFSYLITIPCYIIYGLTINVWITLLIIVVSIGLSLVNKKNKLKLFQSNEEYNEKYGLWANYLWKMLDNLEVIKAFLAKDKIMRENRKRNSELSRTQKMNLKAYLDVCLVEESADILFTLIILCMSFIAMIHNKMSATAIFAMVETLTSVQKYIFQLPEQFIRLQELESMASRISKLKTMEEDPAKEELQEDLVSLNVHNVSFGYEQKEILKGINYTFNKGNFYILAGTSGCGKSTLLKAIARLLPINTGEICWNSHNLAEIKRDSVYKKMAYISQNQMFLEDSIRENICMEEDGETDEKAYDEILRKACVKDILYKNQYDDDKILTSNGWPLSSGECQMVSFANILYKSKQLILLDEAFSAVDPAKEQRFFKYLKLLAQSGATIILVSHRLNNFGMADQILYMENGQISESGSFETLCKKGKQFYTWYKTNQERNAE